MYDAEMGLPGSIIDGTVWAGGGGEPPSLSELYEDMVAGVEGDRHQLDRLELLKLRFWSTKATLPLSTGSSSSRASSQGDTRAGAASIEIYNSELYGGRM